MRSRGVDRAESDHTKVVEGNHYLPPGTVTPDLFRHSDTRKAAPGRATLFLVVGGEHLEDAAWYANDATNNIKDHVTFYDNRLRGVEG